jgi:creatinine amidohydrolase
MKRSYGFRLATMAFSVLMLVAAGDLLAQQAATSPAGVPVKWEELTAPNFIKAVELSGGTCIIPLGVIEKHGPHLPLGTDLIDVRAMVLRAAQKEYSIIFPEYYFSQIFEAKHQPGTIAYGERLLWDMLQSTCDEISRNGIKKIILASGHGGNNSFLPFFCQAQLASRKDYAVYLFQPSSDPAFEAEIAKMRKSTMEAHAGEGETSAILAVRPDLAHQEVATTHSGEDLKRLESLKGVYTGIWWYASFPNHYAGEGKYGSREIGEKELNHQAEQLVRVIREVKADKTVLELQKQFYDESAQPLKTKQ